MSCSIASPSLSTNILSLVPRRASRICASGSSCSPTHTDVEVEATPRIPLDGENGAATGFSGFAGPEEDEVGTAAGAEKVCCRPIRGDDAEAAGDARVCEDDEDILRLAIASDTDVEVEGAEGDCVRGRAKMVTAGTAMGARAGS
jgi:hypothetical protein